jgi:hypothetical protein
MDVLEQQHDLEQVRALLGHKRMDTTQIYATIRPAQLKRAVALRGQGRTSVERIKPPFQSRSGKARCDTAKGSIRGIGRRKEDSNTPTRIQTASNISVFENTPVVSSNVEG